MGWPLFYFILLFTWKSPLTLCPFRLLVTDTVYVPIFNPATGTVQIVPGKAVMDCCVTVPPVSALFTFTVA